MFFDARAAKLLLPGEHLLVDGCDGLRLVATATRRTWTYRYKAADGRMKQLALGQWPALAVQGAAAAWQALRDQRGAGIDPGQQRRETRQAQRSERDDPKRYKVCTLVADYLDGHVDTGRKDAGALAARRALERLLEEEPDFADGPAAGVTRAIAFDLLDDRKAKPTAAAKLRSMLGAAWELALDAGRLPPETPNWWRVVMKGRLKSKGKTLRGKHLGQQRRLLQPADLRALLAWLPNMHLVAQDLTQLYLWTCARGVEICGLRPEHVGKEKDGWWWTVPRELTKNARFEGAVDLRIPLVGRALKIVQRRIKAVGASGWLFEDEKGGQYLQAYFSTYIYNLQPYSSKVEARQGEGLVLPVTGWTPHNLRRTSRTLLSALGCSNEIAEAILGHLPEDIIGIYNSHTYDTERRLWLGKLSSHLEQISAQAATGLPARP